MDWYLQALKKYVDFSGRARRKEYWFFVLFNIIITIVLTIVDMMIGTGGGGGIGILAGIYSLAVLLPGIAVTVRRLHDTGRSGWWILIVLVPLVGTIVLLIFMVMDSQPAPNAYGPSPKAGEMPVATAAT
jgi:uncharacterized membrane protein YhaH (DUF805 family)